MRAGAARGGGGGDDAFALGLDEDLLGLPRGERAAPGGRSRADGRLPPRAARATTPRGRRGLPPKQPQRSPPSSSSSTSAGAATSTQQPQKQREAQQRGAAERADALYALAVRQGRWPPSFSSSSSQPPPQDDAGHSSDDDDNDNNSTNSSTKNRRPLLFEEAAAALAGARLADRLRRKVAPRIANATSWESLHARVLPRDLALLDGRCTALLAAKLARLRPGGLVGGGEGEEEAGTAAAPGSPSSPATAQARRRFDLMVGAVAVATAPKLAGFEDAALANVMAGMAAVAAPVPDLRFLRAWAEAAALASASAAAEGERWAGGREGADLLVTGGVAFGPALLAALLAAQDGDESEEESERQDEPPSSAAAAAAAAAKAAAAFAAVFFRRTAAAFASGELELRHVAPAARAAEALVRCGSPPPGADWWRAAFAAVVSRSGNDESGSDSNSNNSINAAPPPRRRPSPRGSRATVQFAGALASLGAAADAAADASSAGVGPQAAAAAREAAPLLEAELRTRAASSASSSSSSSALSPAGAAVALRGLSSVWRAAAVDAGADGGPSADTVAAVAALWRRRGFRARAAPTAALCDELAAAARRCGASSSAFVPDAEWRAAFEAAVASRMCPPGSEPASGGDEAGDTALPQPLLPLRRLRLMRRGKAAAASAATGQPAAEAASLALSSLALFSGWGHRPGPGWLAAFALSTRDSVAAWPPRVLAAALASLGRALAGGGGGGGSSSSSAAVSPLWALAVLRSLASRASVDGGAYRRALADALAALPPLLLAGGGALATLRALAPSRLSPADVAALRGLRREIGDDDPALDALLEAVLG